MARTILDIAIEAAERDATAPAPSILFGTNNKIAKMLRTAAADTMRDYLARTGWQGVSELHSTWAFAVLPGRQAYALPPDFLRIIPGTEYRDSWPLGLIGPASPQAWSAWLRGGVATPYSMGWRIRNNALWVTPTPTATEIVTIEYVSRYPVVSTVQPGDYDFSGDIPVCQAPFVPRDGQLDVPDGAIPVDDQEGEYESLPGWDLAAFSGDSYEALGLTDPSTTVPPMPQVRRPEFTADTDLPAWDDDYPLSLGMTMRLRRALGKDYAAIEQEYLRALESKANSDAGGPRSFGIGTPLPQSDVLPLGNGRWMVS